MPRRKIDIRDSDMKLFGSNIVDVASYDELKAAVSDGKWARGPWSGRCSSPPLSFTYRLFIRASYLRLVPNDICLEAKPGF